MKLKILFYLIIVSTLQLAHAEIDVSVAMPAIGYITGICESSISVRNISDNVQRSSVTWNDQFMGSGWQLANQYIELYVKSNYYWQMVIYSSNTTAQTGTQRGGLLSTSTTTVRVPLGWVVSDSTVSITNAGEPGELITNNVKGSTITTTIAAPWMYVKDKCDINNEDTSGWDESWPGWLNAGYVTVLYGRGNAMKVNLPYGIYADSPAVLYLEGLFSYIEGKMSYSSPIWFDLVY
ncbi:MAG: hypothetical protein V1833_06630 [Elusimicrobiota bacterium]